MSIIPKNTTIDFISKRHIAFAISIFLVLLSLVLLFTKGLNFGIDFTGGTVIELRAEEDIDISKLRNALQQNPDFGEVSLQNFGSPKDVMIRLNPVKGLSLSTSEVAKNAKQVIAQQISGKIDYRKVDFVGPQVGKELIKAGALSLILAIAAILMYIWIRFEWQFGVGAVVALVHDSILTLGLFSVFQLEFNLTSIAAILTIIGYSINDSVVIYDRIRENLRKFAKKPIAELINKSINDTLSRTLITAGTTIVAVLALVLVGGSVIKGFSIAVLFGVIVGTYSSIYIAAPFLQFFKLNRQPKKKVMDDRP